MPIKAGKGLLIFSISLIFVAYANFAPTALSSELIADYSKNHFVREIIFGIALAAITIRLAIGELTTTNVRLLAFTGSVVVLPFWVAFIFGWSTDGLDAIWGSSIKPSTAYILHGAQTILFYAGLCIVWPHK